MYYTSFTMLSLYYVHSEIVFTMPHNSTIRKLVISLKNILWSTTFFIVSSVLLFYFCMLEIALMSECLIIIIWEGCIDCRAPYSTASYLFCIWVTIVWHKKCYHATIQYVFAFLPKKGSLIFKIQRLTT